MKIVVLTFVLLFSINGHANAERYRDNVTCGNILDDAGGYGPFDYTDPKHNGEDLKRVEDFHFDKNVSRLIKGKSNVLPHKDLDYLLRKFPNHHIALDAMARLQTRELGTPISQSELYQEIYSARCYFERALQVNATDGITWMLYGIYHYRLKEYNESETRYLKAIELIPNNAEVYYNIGLLYVAMNYKEKAQWAAEKAYGLGHPLPGLKNKITSMQ